MPLGLSEYDTDEEAQQTEPAPITAPALAPSPRPVALPGATPVVAPVPTPFLSDAEAEQRETMRRLEYAVQDLPLAQAEQAVSTALKFQGIRGYQRDLANGVTPADALVKWAPIMFAQPKAATLGQAASMVRASRPPMTDKYMDVGGVGYLMRGGTATPITPPKVTPPKAVTLDMPADPENPMSGGRVRIPMSMDDPLVKGAIERARKGPAPPPPEKPGFFTKAAWPSLFGTQEPAVAPIPAAPTAKRTTTPEGKLQMAKDLRRLHPDWSKQEIIDAVNRL